ncbi:MAG: hypothetical protein SGI72_15850 [Planctomycetota bacterium]|nr:hypothetical protein [Planctomycetota bacterium]
MCGWLLRREDECVAATSIIASAPTLNARWSDASPQTSMSQTPPATLSMSARATAPIAGFPYEKAEASESSVIAPQIATTSIARIESTPTWEPWLYLAIGLVTAPVFALTPILKYMGWFLSALVHEMGHAAVAWLCGMPAIPAISLGGHAAAVHQEQSKFLVALIAIGLVWAAWKFLERAWRYVAIALVVVLYPLLALTDGKEFFHLVGGHGTELVFATLCLWKALDGGFTESRLERALYGTVGWYFLGNNALMCFGLISSASARAEYGTSGSFGLTNDYIRLAEDVLNWRLESVAGLMLVGCFLVLPAAIAFWRFTLAQRRG